MAATRDPSTWILKSKNVDICTFFVLVLADTPVSLVYNQTSLLAIISFQTLLPSVCIWYICDCDNIHTYVHTYIHFYSGICTGTENIFIGEFCMNMLRWFWVSTPKWLSFKMRLSFWLQLTYWYGQMGNKDWHFKVAWPGVELSTSGVTGRCLIHYTTSDSVNYDGFTRTLSNVNTKSTNYEEKVIPGI